MSSSSRFSIGRSILVAAAGLSCVGGPEPARPRSQSVSPGQAALARLSPAPILPTTDTQKQVDAAIDDHFKRFGKSRAYLMVDKPLYQPGETIWFRADVREAGTLRHVGAQRGYTVQLVSPRGSVVSEKRVLAQAGWATNDFEIPGESQGGEYVLKLIGDDGTEHSRPIIVNTYEAPRLKKTLEFVKKAYGAGDTVSAALEIRQATGEAFGGKTVTALVTLDDAELARVPVTTDAQGKAVVKFPLPASIARGDGLLTILATDGGMTESIQKRIPIVLKTIDLAMFPEGGDLVAGIPGRVYVSATNTIGKPADVEARVVDDRGAEIATFKTVRDGMGRFEIVPTQGRAYRVEITKPVGIARTFEVPAAKADGCALQALDDFDSADDAMRIATWCTKPQTVLVEAVLRERRVAAASIEVGAKRPAIVALPIDKGSQGAVRVTLFDDARNPLAERLVYRGRGRDLKVAITADKASYSPRDPVTLTVKTTDLAGKPVEASLGLAVVDDTVLSFADDKTAHILSSLYLLPELGTDPIEEPNFYFSDKPEAAAAMDLLMGTRGWRRFEWQLVFQPPVEVVSAEDYYFDDMDVPAAMEAPMAEGAAVPRAAPPPRAPRPVGGMRPAAPAAPRPVVARDRANRGVEEKPREIVIDQRQRRMDRRGGGVAKEAKDEAWGGEFARNRWDWAPVRVFPAPKYEPGYDGPRTDFRETLHWAPEVRTDKDGVATVTFYLSDAVTSFRTVAEGASLGGLPGRGEAVIQSKMPLSLEARLPLEVSAGDVISLPVTLTNETERALTADLRASFGSAFKLGRSPIDGAIQIEAKNKKTFFFPLEVVGRGGEGDVEIAVETTGLRDEIKKKIRVVPLGFPFELSFSGTVDADRPATHTVDLGAALPGTMHASIAMYPSPLATMVQGAEAIIREPGGCFEQTSSSNYPNIMVLEYLGANDAAEPELVERTNGMLDRGYKLLTGYESPEKGYEWFGENPGHEALTAYGLMEFEDMKRVYGDVDQKMIERTAEWLMKRRDGKGGFLRNAKALDSFGRASYETTNAYIVWALTEAKRSKGLEAELDVQRKSGVEGKDPYLVALAANSMLNVGDASGASIASRLAAMQAKDGSFPGAAQTITMSGGEALVIETTSLAVLALIKASTNGQHEPAIRAAVEWLNGHRGGWGEWGSTQGTVLSLKAMSVYAAHSRQTQAAGAATLVVNGRKVGTLSFEKGHKGALLFDDFDAALVAGKNTIEIMLDGDASLPYSVAIEYRAQKPQSSDEAKVSVTTSIAKSNVALGEGVRMRARIVNRASKDGVPMTLARIGIPGGLTFQTWQLKELRDKKVIDFYETRPREVIVYFRAMAPGAEKEVDLDLLAAVPGHYVAPASSAYLYYTDEHKSWAPPVSITVK